MQRKEFEALLARVERLEQNQRALGLPTEPWVSPNDAASLLSTSRATIMEEIKRAEYARKHRLNYDVVWDTHYRKTSSHWQVNPMELKKVIFQPPDQRPYIELYD